ncbi:hypothetical protein [Bacillus cereus]|uniref:hypothetical protein n=1 Tax=Bacillus cereus TaxID=1396 RepID=UPI00234A8DB5|nr:hypothetical protein [Bacillus cereus]
MDTSMEIGKLIITVLFGIAEFEADMIKERQLEDIEEAKHRVVYKGRPKKYTENNRGLQYTLELFYNRAMSKMTVKEIEGALQKNFEVNGFMNGTLSVEIAD